MFSSSRDAVSPSSLCSGVVVSRVRTLSSIHRFRRRFHRSRRFLVWWCTRLVVLWSPSSSSFPPSFSGQRWIGRRVSATPTSTMSSPTPPRPLWTKSSFASSSKKSNRKRSVFLGSSEEQINGSFAIYASHSKRKEDDTQKARCCSSKRGKRRGEKCNKMCLDILPCATRQDTRALARCTRPRCRTPRRFDRARPRSTFFSSSSFFLRRHNRLLLLLLDERSTTLVVRVRGVRRLCVSFFFSKEMKKKKRPSFLVQP